MKSRIKEKIHPLKLFFCRFNAVVLRARFDESNAIKDMRILAQMLEDGEKYDEIINLFIMIF